MKKFWSRRSRTGKAGLIAGLVFVASIAGLMTLGATSGSGQSKSVNKSASSDVRVREALGHKVHAGGYAGEVKIDAVGFDVRRVVVTAQTPEGGFQGTSCDDLGDGARAIFAKIYKDATWNGAATVIYEGGLEDSYTGQALPHAKTGSFTMPLGEAQQINWSDGDSLASIDWSFYRDFCSSALKS